MTSTVVTSDRPPCKPNISASGRRRRELLGVAGLIAAIAVGGALIAFHAAWYWRAIGVFVPTVVAAVGWLQARRFTCIARAREGTYEDDDGKTTKMAELDVRASRKVARTISRDVLLIGVLAAAMAAATAFLR